MLDSNQATRLPNRKQRSGGKIGEQTILSSKSQNFKWIEKLWQFLDVSAIFDQPTCCYAWRHPKHIYIQGFPLAVYTWGGGDKCRGTKR